MSMPILTIDGRPDEWLPKVPYGDPCPCGSESHEPEREWLAVETLPTTSDLDQGFSSQDIRRRPLAAGDRVTLRHRLASDLGFATATVAEVLPIVKYGEHRTVGRYVVVQVEEGSPRAFRLDNSHNREPLWPIRAEEITLPSRQAWRWGG